MAVARYYDASQNPEGAYFSGVPLRDIEQAEWDELPEHVQQSVDASPFYRKTKPTSAKAEKKASADDKGE
jgi:hypothetical protein